MRIIRQFALVIGAAMILLTAGVGVAWLLTAPGGPPRGSESAARLRPGPHSIARAAFAWTDGSRLTPAHAGIEAVQGRGLRTTIWYPVDSAGPHPLVIYAHGLYSSSEGGAYLAEHLASYGYIVAAPTFPLTSRETEGGPDIKDVVNQPGDVSFVIDRVLGLTDAARPFEGAIDSSRIALAGLSLGAATVTLVSFHPELRDPRVAAAIVMAGPGDVFGERFFDHAPTPLLIIAGTADPIVDYRANAVAMRDRAVGSALVSIYGGTHAGFEGTTSGLIRLAGNPDRIGCGAAAPAPAASAPENNPFAGLFGTEEQGLLTPAAYRAPCSVSYAPVMRAGRQQMIATLAARAFLESKFAADAQRRAAHARFLQTTLAQDWAGTSYTRGPHRAGGVATD